MAITFNALFPLFVVVMPQEPGPPVMLMSLQVGKKKKKTQSKLMHKITELDKIYVAAEMLQHDWVLQTYQTQVGQGRNRVSNAGTTEQPFLSPLMKRENIRQTWILLRSVVEDSIQ